MPLLRAGVRRCCSRAAVVRTRQRVGHRLGAGRRFASGDGSSKNTGKQTGSSSIRWGLALVVVVGTAGGVGLTAWAPMWSRRDNGSHEGKRRPRTSLSSTSIGTSIGTTGRYVRSAEVSHDSSSPLSSSQTDFTLADAEAMLRREERKMAFSVGGSDGGKEGSGGGGGCVHVARVASNAPVEDHWAVALGGQEGDEKEQPLLFAVFDGHAGNATSNRLADGFLPYLSERLTAASREASSQDMAAAMRDAFVAFDDAMMNEALAAMDEAGSSPSAPDAKVLRSLAPVTAGSCALVARYERDSGRVTVACTGDSRAVLGQCSSDDDDNDGGDSDNDDKYKYKTVAMSQDQSGSSAAEIARLDADHPGEPRMLDGLHQQGRIFGLMCTRAFGDHRWKLGEPVVRRIQGDYFGSAPRPGMQTSPYLSARPEVTEHLLTRPAQRTGHSSKARRPCFLILATDGLWDYMSSDDAVRCVERWLDHRQGKATATITSKDGTRNAASMGDMTAAAAASAEGQPAATTTKLFKFVDGYAEWRFEPGWYAHRDDNAATHLIRNAFGGRHERFLRGVMGTRPPTSRNVRDDVTVQVIFFDAEPGLGADPA